MSGLPPRYRSLGVVGEGTSGQVHLAFDQQLERQVALKVLHVAEAEASALERFASEAQILARYPHPGIVVILDVNLEHQPPFVVLEWMPGGDLASRIRDQGRLDGRQVARIGARLARALAHLHGHGIVHRDVKPANVLLDAGGEPALADLGLARERRGSGLTRTGMVVGTPLYMAPEVISMGEHSPASDLFSLGLILAELGAGRRLEKPAAFGGEATRLTEALDPPTLRALVRGCLHPDPRQRSGSAAEVARRLEAIAAGDEAAAPTRAVSRPMEVSPASTGALSVFTSGARRIPPRARPWLGLGLGVLALLAGLRGSRAPEPAAPPAPSPTAVEVPAVGDPFGANLGLALEAELEEALAARWDAQGHRVTEGGEHTFVDALSRFGLALQDELPQQVRMLRWLAGGGRLESLSPTTRKALREHDQSFVELGLPPPFRPFLDAAPAPLDPSAPESPEDLPVPDEFAALPPLPAGHPAAGWWRATKVLAARGCRARIGVEEAYRSGSLSLGEDLGSTRRIAVFTGQVPESLAVLVGSLRGSVSGRERIREILAEGRELGRDFLVAAAHALDQPGLPDPDGYGRVSFHAFEHMTGFYMGSLLSATRERFFGGTGRTAACLDFQARVLHDLASIRARTLIPGDIRQDVPTELWRAALEAAEREGPPARAARYWMVLLRDLDERRQGKDFLELYTDRNGRYMVHLDAAAKALLEEQVTQAMLGLVPGPGAGPRGDHGVPSEP